jgi:hypothetical protein
MARIVERMSVKEFRQVTIKLIGGRGALEGHPAGGFGMRLAGVLHFAFTSAFEVFVGGLGQGSLGLGEVGVKLGVGQGKG